jgi:hydroxymethylbilane synthase
VTALLQRSHKGLVVESVVIKSEGDLHAEAPIAEVGDTGVFVRRLEEALLASRIDLAVHSLKDMPSEQPKGLCLAAVPERHDPRDALLSLEGWTLEQVPAGATLATGSNRRKCQILQLRPDLEVVPVRGNVDTLVRKLRDGQFNGLVLALAGVQRLGIDTVGCQPVPRRTCLPAVGQGALGVEARRADTPVRELVEALEHAPSRACVEAERAFLRRLGGGCLAPATAHARIEGGQLRVEAMVGDPEGVTVLLDRESGAPFEAENIGARLAERLLVAGAEGILQSLRQAGPADDGAC